MKIPNKRELQQIAVNHSSDIDFKDLIKIYKMCTAKPYSFLVIDTTLPSDNPLDSERILRLRFIKDQAFNIAKDLKYDGYHTGLASVVYKFFDKKTAGSGIKSMP